MSEEDSEFELLSSITRGASLYFVGKAAVDVLGFVFHFVLARGLGVGLYGVYSYGKSIVMIAIVFTNLGSDKSVLKYLPQYRDEPRRQQLVLGLAILTSVVGAAVAGAVLFGFAPLISAVTLDEAVFVDVLRLFALVLLFETVAKILYSTFRSLERLEYEVLSNKLLRPLLRLVAVLVALGLGFSLLGVMVGIVVANLLALGIAVYFLYTRFDLRPSIPSEEVSRERVYEYYNFSVPLTLQDAGKILMRRVDILMIGIFLSSSAAGIYNVAVLLAGILVLPLAAFSQLFPPIASRLYSDGQIAELNSLYNTVTRWIFTVSFVLAIGAIAYRREILRLFGEEFTVGTLVLVFFVVAQLLNCLGGASGYLLMMTEHQYVLVLNQWTIGLLNVVLNYLFIMEFGLVGAAVATAGALGLLNVVKVAELRYLEGLFPYSTEFLKPLAAGCVAAIVMVLCGFVLSGLPLLVFGGAVGVASYALVLVGLGIEQSDEEFARRMISEGV